MRHASGTLKDIIKDSFESRTAFAKKAGIPASNITRLCTGAMAFTKSNIKKLTSAMLPEDARHLCLSICHDILPRDYHDILSSSSCRVNDAADGYNTVILDKRSEAVLRELRYLAATEADTKAVIHRIGRWILPEPSSANHCQNTPQEETDGPLDAS